MSNKHKRDWFNTCTPKTQRSKSKRPKASGNIDVLPSKKIVDINLDCLEHIFRLLDLKDLMNVASAHQHLKAAANLVFHHKYNKMYVVLFNTNKQCIEPVTINKDRNCMWVQNLKFTFKILRLFGANISKVEIFANYPLRDQACAINVNYDRIMQYLNKYCLESLTSFEVARHPKNVLSAVQKEFKNIEYVSIRGGNITSDVMFQINWIFPKMRRLELISKRFMGLKPIHYPYLEDLQMCILDRDLSRRRNIKPVILSNIDVQSLRVSRHCDTNTWEIISRMKNLNTLRMSYSSMLFKNFNGPPIQFDEVENLDVDVDNSNDEILEPPLTTVFSFGHLKTCTVDCWAEHFTPMLDFIIANPTIEKLTIRLHINRHGSKPLSIGLQLARYVSLAPNPISIELDFYNCHFIDSHIAYVLKFLESNQYLSKFIMRFKTLFAFESVRERIPKQWKIIKLVGNSEIHVIRND